MTHGGGGIEKEGEHDDDENERVDVWRDAERVGEEVAEHRQRPQHAEHGGDLDDVLLGEVVARVELEDEHVVDARRPPPVHVEAHEEEEHDDEQRAAIESEDDLPAGVVRVPAVVVKET